MSLQRIERGEKGLRRPPTRIVLESGEFCCRRRRKGKVEFKVEPFITQEEKPSPRSPRKGRKEKIFTWMRGREGGSRRYFPADIKVRLVRPYPFCKKRKKGRAWIRPERGGQADCLLLRRERECRRVRRVYSGTKTWHTVYDFKKGKDDEIREGLKEEQD